MVAIIVAITLLVTRGSRTEKPQAEAPRTIQVTDYDNDDSQIIYTLQGPVVGNDARRSIRIIVDSDSRTIEQIDGYQNKVAKTQTYSNNNEGYQYFLAALNHAGYTKERRTRQTDSKGMCPTGQVYIFQIRDGNDTVMDRWSASCGGIGTYGGDTGLSRVLFENQITDYNTFINGVEL